MYPPKTKSFFFQQVKSKKMLCLNYFRTCLKQIQGL